MWFINCTSFRLEWNDINGPNPKPYWILSHTWGADEVSFQDIQDLERASQKRGVSKIRTISELALIGGCAHAWVDTCCIDKTSSAELTESINSMFLWYLKAERCVAYLEGLEAGTGTATEAELRNCKWFTRGWTLQELIAPQRMTFYDGKRNAQGEKMEMLETLHAITRISRSVLAPLTWSILTILEEIPVAQKMSWAATRKTTRVEDIAYCLLGIFDVNMPLIYGERHQAFVRLQQMIAQKSQDLSLFAWFEEELWREDCHGLFARHPCQFSACRCVTYVSDSLAPKPSWIVTNAGIEITTALDSSTDSEHHVLRVNAGETISVVQRRSAEPFCYRLLLNSVAMDVEGLERGESRLPPVLAIWLRNTASGFVRYKADRVICGTAVCHGVQ